MSLPANLPGSAWEIGLLVGIIVGLGAALLGLFIIMRHLALAGDALSHIALPGVGLAVIIGFNPFFGALTALLIGVLLIVLIERRAPISTDTAIGVLLSAGLALGALFFPNAEKLLDTLFGNLYLLKPTDAWLGIIFGGGALVIILLKFKDFTRFTLSPELARSEGVRVESTELLLLLLLAALVAAGIKVIGILLLGALVVIPAATARNIGGGIRKVALITAVVGIVTVVGGLTAAAFLRLPPGPMVVVTNIIVFSLSLIRRRLVSFPL